MGRSQAAVPRQMDTHTSIIIINSMKGSPGATAEAMVAGQLRQPFRRWLLSAMHHEVCSILYACAAGGDFDTTAIKRAATSTAAVAATKTTTAIKANLSSVDNSADIDFVFVCSSSSNKLLHIYNMLSLHCCCLTPAGGFVAVVVVVAGCRKLRLESGNLYNILQL